MGRRERARGHRAVASRSGRRLRGKGQRRPDATVGRGNGHEATVRLLFDQGADFEAKESTAEHDCCRPPGMGTRPPAAALLHADFEGKGQVQPDATIVGRRERAQGHRAAASCLGH